MNGTTDPFPCPFCHSNRVVLTGGALVFVHYECMDCAEVWTAMAPGASFPHRPKSGTAKLTPHVTRKEKLCPH